MTSDGNWVVPRPSGTTSSGVDANGAPVTFPFETSPFKTTQITFLQAYIRVTARNQFAQNDGAIVSPEQGVFVGNGNAYQAGQTTIIGVNEAAALVARGIAEYS
jgi:hypothetical protein